MTRLAALALVLAACGSDPLPRYTCGENTEACGEAKTVRCAIDEACVTDNGVRAGCHWCRPDEACDSPRDYCTDRRPELAAPMCGSTELSATDADGNTEPAAVTIVFCN